MYRFASWIAVSSKPQVKDGDEDKESLPNQERQCKAMGERHGWHNTELVYTVPGQSRTRYVDLTVAVMEIPALREMLDGARKGQFNLLVMYDLNRLRDLLRPVAKTLQDYGVQIFSVNQPIELQPPDTFNPYATSSPKMIMGLSQIISDEQVADLQRKYRSGNTARAEKGLHMNSVPWGYRVISKKLPAVQVPEEVAIILKVKNYFWQGWSYTEIADELNKQNIPSPRGSVWRHSAIRKILSSRYYAGRVYFGQTTNKRDHYLNKLFTRANPDVEYKIGKHVAVWTWDEHLAIMAEMQQRAKRPRRDYVFSGLLWCSVCGDRLFLSGAYNGWTCKKYCTGLKNYEVNAIVFAALKKALGNVPPVRVEKAENELSGELESLLVQRRRIQNLYKTGSPIYTQDEAEREILKLDAKIKALQTNEADQALQQARREMYAKTLEEWRRKLSALPAMAAEREPKEINGVLRQLCKRVVVTPDARVTVELWI